MKLHKLTCPNCKGSLKMDIAKSTNSIFCPYCGQSFFLDEEKKEHTINKNINITKTTHNRWTDDADVIRAKNEGTNNRQDFLLMLIVLGVFVAMVIGLAISDFVLPSIKTTVAKHKGHVSAGYYEDLIGEDYKTVEAHFEAAGFTNIELIDLNDSGLFVKAGKVKTISVGGNTSFDSEDYFSPDTIVIISYH